MSEHEVSSSKLAGYTGHGQECPAGLETYHCFPGSIGVCGYLAGSGTSCIGTAGEMLSTQAFYLEIYIVSTLHALKLTLCVGC